MSQSWPSDEWIENFNEPIINKDELISIEKITDLIYESEISQEIISIVAECCDVSHEVAKESFFKFMETAQGGKEHER